MESILQDTNKLPTMSVLFRVFMNSITNFRYLKMNERLTYTTWIMNISCIYLNEDDALTWIERPFPSCHSLHAKDV